MDISVYLRILSDRLAEQDVDQATIEKILNRERALLAGVSSKDFAELMNDERLEIIVASATSKRASSEKSSHEKSVRVKDEKHVMHDRSNATLFLPSADQTTVTVSDDNTRITALATDTATIVISRDTNRTNYEERTVAVPPQIERLLHETGTVRISEKDAAFYRIDSDLTSEESTVPIAPTAPSIHPFEETTYIPSESNAIKVEESPATSPGVASLPPHPGVKAPTSITSAMAQPREKEESAEGIPLQPLSLVLPQTPTITSDDLRNKHPRLALVWLSIVFAPTILLFLTMIALTALVGNIALLIAFSLCVLLYLGFFGGSVFLAIYSTVAAFISLSEGEWLKAVTELGIIFCTMGVSIFFATFLFRPIRYISDKMVDVIYSFNKKIALLIRNLYRYTLKGAERV